MVNTGIKKYDELPARIRLIDIDVLRFQYVSFSKDIDKLAYEFKELKNKLDGLADKYRKDNGIYVHSEPCEKCGSVTCCEHCTWVEGCPEGMKKAPKWFKFIIKLYEKIKTKKS